MRKDCSLSSWGRARVLCSWSWFDSRSSQQDSGKRRNSRQRKEVMNWFCCRELVICRFFLCLLFVCVTTRWTESLQKTHSDICIHTCTCVKTAISVHVWKQLDNLFFFLYCLQEVRSMQHLQTSSHVNVFKCFVERTRQCLFVKRDACELPEMKLLSCQHRV